MNPRLKDRAPRTLSTLAPRMTTAELTPELPATTVDDMLALDLNKPYHEFIREAAESYWKHKLTKYHRRMSIIARIAGVNRTDMYKRLRRLGIRVADMRTEPEQ